MGHPAFKQSGEQPHVLPSHCPRGEEPIRAGRRTNRVEHLGQREGIGWLARTRRPLARHLASAKGKARSTCCGNWCRSQRGDQVLRHRSNRLRTMMANGWRRSDRALDGLADRRRAAWLASVAAHAYRGFAVGMIRHRIASAAALQAAGAALSHSAGRWAECGRPDLGGRCRSTGPVGSAGTPSEAVGDWDWPSLWPRSASTLTKPSNPSNAAARFFRQVKAQCSFRWFKTRTTCTFAQFASVSRARLPTRHRAGDMKRFAFRSPSLVSR